MTMNKVILIGRLGKDPELSYTQGGTAVCKFSLATSERWTDREGQKQESTEWHSIVIWGKQAEVAGKYLEKGRLVSLEGKNKTSNWEDQQSGKKMYWTEVEVSKIYFLSTGDQMKGRQQAGQSGGQQGRQQGQQQSTPPAGQDQGPGMGPDDDDIPF